ncbi:hypothetical protein [Klebsiella pneumoniae]|uniref:hypothetical protein n=1 Tax=Klebsiella pneumoniae TaxID=573 RepID=UPI003987F8AC
MQIVQRHGGDIEPAVNVNFALEAWTSPEIRQPDLVRHPQQIIHQQRAAKKAAVGIPCIAGQRIPGEQPQRQVELTLTQGAVDLPQLV